MQTSIEADRIDFFFIANWKSFSCPSEEVPRLWSLVGILLDPKLGRHRPKFQVALTVKEYSLILVGREKYKENTGTAITKL